MCRAFRSKPSCKAYLFAAALLIAAPAQASDLIFGQFTLDPARSTGGDACAVETLEDLGNGKFRLAGTRQASDGTIETSEGVFAFDGGVHSDGTGSLAFMRIDPLRYAITGNRNGRFTAMRSMTEDGATMVETTDGVRNGKPFRTSRVFIRGNASCPAGDPQ